LPFELAIRTSLSDVELRQKGTSNIGYNVLNNGLVCPIVGISTSHENILFESIKQGVRLIDTSLCNLAEIAPAIAQAVNAGVVNRADLFIVTKVADIHHDRIKESLDHQLATLGLEYTDLHIIETPWELEARSHNQINSEYKTDNNDKPIFKGGEGIPVKKTTKLTDKWTKMEDLYNEGRAKAIGVGNFDKGLIEQLLSFCKVKPSVNAVECNLFIQQPELLDYLRKHNIVMQATSSLVETIPDEVKTLATLNKRTQEQVLTRYLCQKGIQVMIPTSSISSIISPKDLAFSINSGETHLLAKLDRAERRFYCKVTATVENKYYPKSWTREPGFANA